MDFYAAYAAIQDGKRVRRAMWREQAELYGDWLELVTPPPLPDGRRISPMVMVWARKWDMFVPWGGVHLDIPGLDWEIVS